VAVVAAAAAVVAAGVILALAVPRHTSADSGAAFASGAGLLTYGPPSDEVERFSFTGHMKPDGEPTGSIVVHSTIPPFEPLFLKADVTCTVIIGKTARVGGVIREPAQIGGVTVYAVALQLQDNGAPGQSADLADVWLIVARPGRDDQTPCLIPLPPASQPLDEGNVVVNGHEGSRIVR
jgi:hypothetical protein